MNDLSDSKIEIKAVEVSIETINLEPGDLLVFTVPDTFLIEHDRYADTYLRERLPEDTKFIIISESIKITKVHQE